LLKAQNKSLVDIAAGKKNQFLGHLEHCMPREGFPNENLSFNCRGLAGSLKITSLYMLVESNQPDIMMLHETMGEEVVIIPQLFSLLKSWEFVGSDARGHSGGLAIGWNPKIVKVISSWGFESGLGLNILSKETGSEVTILNLYGPYQERAFFGKL
jgi:hypothetical protein